MKRVSVLGSTGSVGVSTLDVLSRHADRFEVFALTASTQIDLLFQQIVRFKPAYAMVASEPHASLLAQRVADHGLTTEVLGASTDLRHLVALVGRPLPGVPSAIVAMLGFGAWSALMALAVRSQDQLALILVGRVAGFAVMLLIALALRSGPPADRSPATLALVAIVGLFDTVANVLFVSGLASGEATIVVTASGLYPVLPVLLAIVFLGERLAPNQYVGVAILLGGLLGLGLQR